MITFRKIATAEGGRGQILRRYFTENTPEPTHDPARDFEKNADSGGRLTAYYTSRDSRATWRPDMSADAAAALGIDPRMMPRDEELDRLFEGRRADNGEAWSKHKRQISGYDFTAAPHKSVTLAAEFAPTAAEGAAIWHALDKANDATMRYIARELGWARLGAGGEDGAEPGAVGWVSFRHHVARPTMPVQDGRNGATFLMDLPVDGDPHAHIHNFLFNMVATGEGRIGSLDTQRLHTRVHEFGAYFQARLADELRRLGVDIGYNADEQAVVIKSIPIEAVAAFSKSRRQILGNAKAFAESQGLTWDVLSVERKIDILSQAGVASRLSKHGHQTDREIWMAQAELLGWKHASVLRQISHSSMTDEERFDRAYRHAAKHLAREFNTAAVIDHDKLRIHAARGLIMTGITGIEDIDRVTALIEQRGLKLKGEHVALVVGVMEKTVRVTNTAQIRVEQTLGALARAAAGDLGRALPFQAIRDAIAASGLDRTGEREHWEAQRAAIHAIGQSGALTLLTGVAGAGKTTLMAPLVQAWKADTRFDPDGREVVGLATAWKQADALKDAGIARGYAVMPMLDAIKKGEFQPTRNTVLVIDEVSQIGPRQMLAILELQARTGMTIKALGDREQAQAIEAGDTIEIFRRALPKSARPELLSSIRQSTHRGREIASLFRQRRAGEALEIKRDDGTAILAGGDEDQVIRRIADLFMERRDHVRAAGSHKPVTISTLTNDDAARISQAVRQQLQDRGEISTDQVLYKAVDQRGKTFTLPIAVGDSLRLFRRTQAMIDGQSRPLGNNGDIVTVLGRSADGLTLRNSRGQVGTVEWRRLSDPESGRLLLGFGHAMTVDAAQGVTSAEHINALPRGSAGITAFKGYVAESRSTGATWTVVSEAAVHEAEKRSRALGSNKPITAVDLWARIATDMSAKPYKALAIDLAKSVRHDWETAIDGFIDTRHRIEAGALAGQNPGKTVRDRLRVDAIVQQLDRHLPALQEALSRNLAEAKSVSAEVIANLSLAGQEAGRAQARLNAARLVPNTPGPGD